MMKAQLYALCLLGALAGCRSSVSGDVVRDSGGSDSDQITGSDNPPPTDDVPCACDRRTLRSWKRAPLSGANAEAEEIRHG